MGSRFSNLKCFLLLVGAMAAVSSAQAQAGQSISFSSPANSDGSSDASSLSAKTTDLPDLPNELRAPPSFNSEDIPATPQSFAPAASPAQGERLKKLLDDRSNWALMTPEEILGVDTPEKILQVSGRDAAGQKKNPTAVDRYYQRQDQAQTSGSKGYDYKARDQNEADAFNPVSSRLGNSGQILNQPPVIAPENGILGGQSDDSGWSKLFGSSQQPPVSDPAQQAAADRFKQLLEPSHTPTMTTPSSGDTTSPYSLRQTFPNDGFGQTPATAASVSYTPLSSGIGTASGLTALGAQNNLKPAAPPPWAPKPAPWLSKTPQPFVVPQQKF
ncbi:MAG TPA: hypothetical protein VGH42_14795 [Verrucomicrobiae bacterium]|jgi:hypothetical protein